MRNLKIILLLLITSLFFTLVACSNNSNDEDKNPNPEPSNNVELTYELSTDKTYYIVTGYQQSDKKIVLVPDTYNDLPVKEIKANAFKGNKNITTVNFSKNIETIGAAVLKDCSSIKELTMAKLYGGFIGYIFGGDSSSNNASFVPKTLEKITITNEIELPEKAFSNAVNIKKIHFLNNLKTIGKNSFYGCSLLEEISLPNSLSLVKENAFYNCDKLSIVKFNGSIDDWCKIYFENLHSTPMCYNAEIELNDDIEEIVISNTLNTINQYQFYGFKNTKKITIDSSILNIESNAFTNMDSLEEFNIVNNQNYKDIDGVLYSSDETILISYPAARQGNIYNLVSTTKVIEDYAFSNNQILKEVVLNEGLKSIGKYAFNNSLLLEKVHIISSVNKLEEGTFFNCQNLIDIYLSDNLEYIGISTFEYCNKLETIFIPESVRTIKAYAFRNCPNLTIYCEVINEPSGWESSYWNVYPGCPVLWNQTR